MITAPTTKIGRTYTISNSDYDETMAVSMSSIVNFSETVLFYNFFLKKILFLLPASFCLQGLLFVKSVFNFLTRNLRKASTLTSYCE